MKLSILVPAFNEESTIAAVLEKLIDLKIPDVETEVIVVDDGSTDATYAIASRVVADAPAAKLIAHSRNAGKGAAISTALSAAGGEYVIIQDADLEYDPAFIPELVGNIDSRYRVVYGTRLNRAPRLSNEERTPRFLLHYVGNRMLSLIATILYGHWLTDMETGYKLFPREVVQGMKLRSRRFDFEPEITAKLLKKGLRIKEVPITTNPRSYAEGKKLNTVRDGVMALWTLVKYRFTD